LFHLELDGNEISEIYCGHKPSNVMVGWRKRAAEDDEFLRGFY